MEEKIKLSHGGKRQGAGRKKSDNSKVQTALKLDKDLSIVFDSPQFKDKGLVRGRYINDAVREKMLRDGYLEL